MLKVNFVYYRSDKYATSSSALRADAMFQPSSNIPAWELKSDTLEQVKEITELCSMYRAFSGKTKVFGICASGVFISVDEVVANRIALNSGKLTILDLVLSKPKQRVQPLKTKRINKENTEIPMTRGEKLIMDYLNP